jgi:hypothetical protein
MENIAVAIIAAIASILASAISLVGVIISNSKANEKNQKQFEIAQAVMKNDIEELTREVREHNNFARRMPVVEAEIKMIHKRISEYHAGG